MKNFTKYIFHQFRLYFHGPKQLINDSHVGQCSRSIETTFSNTGINEEDSINMQNVLYKKIPSFNTNPKKLYESKLTRPKPFSQIPGPSGWPLIGTLWDYIKKNGYGFDRMFLAQLERSKSFGPIYKEKIGPEQLVVITDPKEYSKVVRTDSKYPRRMALEPMVHYRNIKNLPIGLFNAVGEDWHKYRKALNHKMLDTSEAINYLPKLNNVSVEFVQGLSKMLEQNQIICMESQMFKWAMESIGVLLFDSRLNCLYEPMPPETKLFIESVSGYTRTLQSLMTNFPWYKIYKNQLWLENEKYSDIIFETGLRLVESKMKEYNKERYNDLHNYSILHHLLSTTDWTGKEINVTLVDLMMAAIETTCFAVLWTLYCLAKNPMAQEKLFKEIKEHLPYTENPLTLPISHKMTYLKGCLQESLRLYPVVYTTSRLIEKDIVIKDYLIPKKTHVQGSLFTMGRDEKIFDKPEIYLPERWAKENVVTQLKNKISADNIFEVKKGAKLMFEQHNFACPYKHQDKENLAVKKMSIEESRFASLPWGHGSRMCIGRKISEMEIYTVLINIVREFEIKLNDPNLNAQPVVHLVVCPKEKIDFKLIKR